MTEWLVIRDENGDTYIFNANEIIYIDKYGIVLRSCGRLTIPIDVEEVDRVIVGSRETAERWLNGKSD